MTEATVLLYVVQFPTGNFFGGFDKIKKVAILTENPLLAKKFTNKNDIKLRPDEKLVEISVNLLNANAKLSQPFRPVKGKS